MESEMPSILHWRTMPLLPLFALVVVAALSQTAPKPALSETLEWLNGATDQESGDGNDHITFESKGCGVVITETRLKADPGWWLKESFSLADIDPDDIQVEELAKGELGKGQLKKFFEGLSAVRFHTTNYRKSIISSTRGPFVPGGALLDKPSEISTSDYSFTTNDSFAPRFTKALKRAAELCGGKRSSF
jgi:hypothetical protein